MEPKNHEDLMFKLRQPFNTVKDLLNFFESNRDIFDKESYQILF